MPLCMGLHARSSCGITNSHSHGQEMIPILQKRKQKPREIRKISPGPAGPKGQNWNTSPGLHSLKAQVSSPPLSWLRAHQVLPENSSKQDTLFLFPAFRSPSISQHPRHLLQNCFLFCFPPAADVTGRLTPRFNLGAKNPIKLPSVSIKKEKVHLERFHFPYRVSSATANSLCPQVMGGDDAPASTEALTLSCDIGWVALMGSCSKPTCGVTSVYVLGMTCGYLCPSQSKRLTEESGEQPSEPLGTGTPVPGGGSAGHLQSNPCRKRNP